MMRRHDASSPRSINPFSSKIFCPSLPLIQPFASSEFLFFLLIFYLQLHIIVMATSMYEGGYNDSNRAFLQAFMARSTMTFDEAKPVLAAIFSAQGISSILLFFLFLHTKPFAPRKPPSPRRRHNPSRPQLLHRSRQQRHIAL